MQLPLYMFILQGFGDVTGLEIIMGHAIWCIQYSAYTMKIQCASMYIHCTNVHVGVLLLDTAYCSAYQVILV